MYSGTNYGITTETDVSKVSAYFVNMNTTDIIVELEVASISDIINCPYINTELTMENEG